MKLFHLTLLHNSSLLDGLITTEHTEITEKRKKDLKFPSVISVVNLIYATTPFYFVFCAVILPLSGFTDAPRKEENCPDGKQHYRATLRHIEKGGIGYEDGYTTLEAFLSSDPSQWRVTPFLDVRGHLSDSGKWAANAGTGLRFLWKNRAYGVNTYYDYRNTDHFNSHQIGAGLETLGE
ncbi:MAG TPA: hypothetical protein VLF94_06355, partial [Chlamydiales bacterium]|nr:hypothetical protein [Chlamydiales bacterium]